MLRITGGELRGRLIEAPAGDQVRPTQSRLRQALMNSLQMKLGAARVLDLFAGSGALGIEALSWGAAHASFVENARPSLQALEKNLSTLQLQSRSHVFAQSVDRVTPQLLAHVKAHGAFDVVFADPPYADGWELRLLAELPWGSLLSPEGVVCLEWGTQKSQPTELPESVGGLQKVREKIYGDSILTTYSRALSASPQEQP